MRKLVLVGVFLAAIGAMKDADACGPRETTQIEVIVVPPSPVATQQSQTLLADATKLDGKADIEESASATVVLTARTQRRKAASIRVQAAQVSGPSQAALLAKADKLEADAMTNDAASATFLARAKIIRTRARALRALSTKVLTSGALTTQVLPSITLPAPPAGHPDASAVRTLDAAPKIKVARTMVAAI